MIKKNKSLFKEFTSNLMGDPTFQGGSFGFGNTRQLATNLNPSTQRIVDQTDKEVNKNISDLDWNMGLYTGSPMPLQRQDDMEPYAMAPVKEDVLDNGPSGGFGNARINSLVEPKIFVPQENPRETDDYLIDDIADEIVLECMENLLKEFMATNTATAITAFYPRIDYKEHEGELGHVGLTPAESATSMGLGTVLAAKKFIPDDYQASLNKPEDPEHLDRPDDIINPIITGEKDMNEAFKSSAQARYFYSQARKPGKYGKKWKKMADEFSSKTDYKHLPAKIKETNLSNLIEFLLNNNQE